MSTPMTIIKQIHIFSFPMRSVLGACGSICPFKTASSLSSLLGSVSLTPEQKAPTITTDSREELLTTIIVV